jgi:hypothetical protein
MSKSQEPKACPKIITLQVAWPASDGRSLDDLISATRKLVTDELVPSRTTLLDSYYLIEGQRVTPADLARRPKENAVATTDSPSAETVDTAIPVAVAAGNGEWIGPVPDKDR